MLTSPPEEIQDLVSYVYDEDGLIIGEQISKDATAEQKALFERYMQECRDLRKQAFNINIGNEHS
ncbi:hypothetical protein [[Clostridium] innocuum]|jgi:hypothetical protein|uniref:hypothetical protein n=1 Tax=Clostridium innocuum TaxID=1522 RepID=UPI00206B77DD|nr:MAG TPA: Mediator of RNA polymerase II, Transcription Activation, Helical, ABD [Caudoviricetes sp.]